MFICQLNPINARTAADKLIVYFNKQEVIAWILIPKTKIAKFVRAYIAPYL